MAEPETEKTSHSVSATKEHTFPMPDWSLLPKELLQIISKNLENCFDVVHARSVCSLWRCTFPFSACLLRPSYSLPRFADFPVNGKDLCTVEKIPLFLFRVQTPHVAAASPSEYFLGGICRDESDDHMELPSPLQCSLKVKIPGSDPTLMNMLNCQILPLGHQYRMIGWDPKKWTTNDGGLAFLPLNKDRRGEFVMLLKYSKALVVLLSRSAEMRLRLIARV